MEAKERSSDLPDMHLVPPVLNVDVISASVTYLLPQTTVLVTIIKHPWSATALSTVGGNAFHEVFLVHTTLWIEEC
jgi:hypothetical protein